MQLAAAESWVRGERQPTAAADDGSWVTRSSECIPRGAVVRSFAIPGGERQSAAWRLAPMAARDGVALTVSGSFEPDLTRVGVPIERVARRRSMEAAGKAVASLQEIGISPCSLPVLRLAKA